MSNKEEFMTKLRRIVRTGFYTFWRNGTVSLASVLVMIVSLWAIGSIAFGSALLDTALAELKDKIDVNVSFVTTAKEEDVLAVKHSLESLPEVLLVTYVSPEEALAAFKERHQNDQSILAALDELGENPLGAVLNVKARDPSQYASVAEFLGGDGALSASGVSIIDRVNYFQNKTAIDRLTAIIRSADKLGFLLTLAMAGIATLIAFTTIRLTIYIARDEISVMRLVGASKAYIQGPFVVVGTIYGLAGGLATLILFFPAAYYAASATGSFFSGFSIFSYYLRHFFEIAGIVLVSGILIGALSSMLAVRRYLKV
jgi:cell division transport system permease protein